MQVLSLLGSHWNHAGVLCYVVKRGNKEDLDQHHGLKAIWAMLPGPGE